MPEEKGEAARREEIERFDYIGLTGTYPGIERMMSVVQLWRSYQAGADINARIAKEVDKLENLMQLYRYREAGHVITDFFEWERGLCDAVTTEVGVSIREIIRAAFPQIAVAFTGVANQRPIEKGSQRSAPKKPRRRGSVVSRRRRR